MAFTKSSTRSPLASGTAFVMVMLSGGLMGGCTGPGMAMRTHSASGAETNLAKADAQGSVKKAEALVAVRPNDSSLRVVLGQAYFRDGRFISAATSFDDAMKLGDNSAKTALNLVLARIGSGDQQGALRLLEDWRGEIPVSDLGLALSLAGEPDRGVAVLSDAIRSGENTVKVRQNLAYSYALANRWREARMMASQDVPPELIDKRISDWAETIQPEHYQQRVAALIGVPVRADSGQPAALALVTSPAAEQLAVQQSANAVVSEVKPAERQLAARELPAVSEMAAQDNVKAMAVAAAPVPAPSLAPSLASVAVPVAPAPVVAKSSLEAIRTAYVAKPVARVQTAAVTPTYNTAKGTHMVQLGAFSSREGARRAWGIYSHKDASLTAYRMDIRPVVVKGRQFWRVAAAGITGAENATGLCSQLKARGSQCFAYAVGAPQKNVSPVRQAQQAVGPQMARRR